MVLAAAVPTDPWRKAANVSALQGGGSAKRRRMIDAPARNGEVEDVREANEGRAG